MEDPLLLYLGSLSPKRRATAAAHLPALVRLMQVQYEHLEWLDLRGAHVESIRQALTQRHIPLSTMNVTLHDS